MGVHVHDAAVATVPWRSACSDLERRIGAAYHTLGAPEGVVAPLELCVGAPAAAIWKTLPEYLLSPRII